MLFLNYFDQEAFYTQHFLDLFSTIRLFFEQFKDHCIISFSDRFEHVLNIPLLVFNKGFYGFAIEGYHFKHSKQAC
jgi:hypothetical protein